MTDPVRQFTLLTNKRHFAQKLSQPIRKEVYTSILSEIFFFHSVRTKSFSFPTKHNIKFSNRQKHISYSKVRSLNFILRMILSPKSGILFPTSWNNCRHIFSVNRIVGYILSKTSGRGRLLGPLLNHKILSLAF